MSRHKEEPPGPGWVARAPTGCYPGTVATVWELDRHGDFSVGFCCRPEHDNGNGAMHGGIVASLADMGLGGLVGRYRNPDGAKGANRLISATIQLDISFASAALIGDFVQSRATITHSTRTMTFASGTLVVGDRTVATMQGIFKLVGRRTAG